MPHDFQITEEEYKRAIAVIDDAGSQMRLMRMDDTSKSVRVNLWVWNTSTLIWERMKQPTLQVGDLTVTMGDLEKLLSGHYWKDQRLTYSSGDLVYKALHTTINTATSATTWWIWKYTWTSGDLVRIQGPLIGSVDGQSSLGWS